MQRRNKAYGTVKKTANYQGTSHFMTLTLPPFSNAPRSQRIALASGRNSALRTRSSLQARRDDQPCAAGPVENPPMGQVRSCWKTRCSDRGKPAPSRNYLNGKVRIRPTAAPTPELAGISALPGCCMRRRRRCSWPGCCRSYFRPRRHDRQSVEAMMAGRAGEGARRCKRTCRKYAYFAGGALLRPRLPEGSRSEWADSMGALAKRPATKAGWKACAGGPCLQGNA